MAPVAHLPELEPDVIADSPFPASIPVIRPGSPEFGELFGQIRQAKG